MTRKLEAVREINIKVELQISKPGYSHLRNRLNKKHNLKDVAARGIPHQLFVFKGSWSFSKSYPAQVVLVAFRHSTLTNHHRVDQKKTSCQSGMAEVRNTSWKRSLLPAKRTQFEKNRQTKLWATRAKKHWAASKSFCLSLLYWLKRIPTVDYNILPSGKLT